jgi:hypothetical protein
VVTASSFASSEKAVVETDFSLEEISLFCVNKTILLPSEY